MCVYIYITYRCVYIHTDAYNVELWMYTYMYNIYNVRTDADIVYVPIWPHVYAHSRDVYRIGGVL